MFVLLYIATTVLFIPGLILTIGSGFAFSNTTDSLPLGVLIGTTLSFTGAIIGA